MMAKVSKEEVVQWYAQNRGLYKKLSEKIAIILNELLEASNVPIHAITNRAKEIDSLKTKITNPKYEDPANQITDFAGIRIIAYVEDDLKPICEVIRNVFTVDEENSGDKSEDLGTDKVGYKSIHFIATIKPDRLNLPEYKKFKNLRFEIQVRTILQHAWAEIEHDRNYKFNGILPPEITRRFKILAGTLELADREFNQLSKEIDLISNNVTIADKHHKLNEISISSTTLKRFLNDKFNMLINEGLLVPNFNGLDDEVIQELDAFGVNNLSELEKLIPQDFIKTQKEFVSVNSPNNFLSILRQLMIINDANLYFSKCWNENWQGAGQTSCNIYEHYKLDLESLSKEYGINWDISTY